MNNEKIGFIGLGNMGHPMAKNLEKAGFALAVYNRTTEKAQDFESKSTVCKSIKELIEHSDIVITMLTNDSAVEAVYKEILDGNNLSGKLFVDMSTISQKMSKEVGNAVKIEEASFIDAPVAGSTKPAAEGTLIIMVGGENKDLERATTYLEKLGKIKHLGENGKGLAAKISINYFLAMIYEGLAETVLLSDHLGIAREAMLDIINESASGSGATKVKTPLLIDNNFAPAFALDLMLKDIRLAKDAGADFPTGASILDTYTKASEKGFGKNDVIGIIDYLKQKS